MFQELLIKTIQEKYPGLIEGKEQYDFSEYERSEAQIEHHNEVVKIMESSFNETEKVEIFNDVYHMI